MRLHRQAVRLITPPHKQAGVALITAILLVALATALAAKLAWDNQISMRRTESTLSLEQARLFALGAETGAILLLQEDSNLDADYWSEELKNEIWGSSVGPLELQNGIDETVLGVLQFQTFDAHARFNLNNLVQYNGLDAVAEEQLINLIEILSKKPEYRELNISTTLVDNIIDFIDSDTVPHKSGVEDGSYTSLEIPYRPPNNYLINLSELRTVFGVTEEIYEVLKNYVTVLPPGWCGGAAGNTTTGINFNSADVDVIQALGTGANPISPGDAESWVSQREATPFEDISEVTGLPQDIIGGGYAAVNSNCFEVIAQVNVGSSVMYMYSLLDRGGPNGEIITRIRTFDIE